MIDYGIDAPGVRRAMFAVGSLAAVALGLALVLLRGWAQDVVATLAALACAYGLAMGAYMTWASRVGKVFAREAMLERVAAMARLDAGVALDVGCGLGLMAVGVAQRFPALVTIGIDVWRAQDQSGGGAHGARRNAALAGVGGRIHLVRADARAVPLPDGACALVVSHWVVHNVDDAAGRSAAIAEMWRVLAPGGVVALADIAHVDEAAAELAALGMTDVVVRDARPETRLMRVLSFGSYAPREIYATKPG